MFAPASEALDLFESAFKVINDTVLEFLLVGQQLDPKVMHLGQSLLVKLDNYSLVRLTRITFLDFFAFYSIGLELQVSKKVEFVLLRISTGIRNKVIDGLDGDLLFGDGLSVVKSHLQVEKRLEGALGLTIALGIVKVHYHNLVKLLSTVIVKLTKAADHLFD